MESKQGVEPLAGVTPHLVVKDGAGAIDFYGRAFGAEELLRMPAEDGKRLLHGHLKINGSSVMLADDFPEYRGGTPMGEPAGVTIHLQVDDADRWYDRAVTAGATATMPPANMFWGDRYGQLRDPFGHTWSIGSHIDKH
jgi:PhnB protein